MLIRLNPYCSGRWSNIGRGGKQAQGSRVLILIVVEDGLVLLVFVLQLTSHSVLILVVVEDGLVLLVFVLQLTSHSVLILVVVEDGLVRNHYYRRY